MLYTTSNKAADESLFEQQVSKMKIETVLVQKPSKRFSIKSDFFKHHKM